MDATELLKLFRADVNDAVEPYLWSDDECYSYMDRAQKLFCQRTGGLGGVFTLAVTTDSDEVRLDPRILKIRGATKKTDGRPIKVLNYEDMPEQGLYFDGIVGDVSRLIIGMEINKARVHPFPRAALDIVLTVDRLPLKTLARETAIEIPEEHQPGLMLYMKHLAYSKDDEETRNPNKAASAESQFENFCETARRARERAKGKVRVVRYGGI